jgi:hypothetical protein
MWWLYSEVGHAARAYVASLCRVRHYARACRVRRCVTVRSLRAVASALYSEVGQACVRSLQQGPRSTMPHREAADLALQRSLGRPREAVGLGDVITRATHARTQVRV